MAAALDFGRQSRTVSASKRPRALASPLRIAFVVHDYHRHGGHARYVAELATRLRAQHEVHVFANTFEEADPRGIQFHRVPAVRWNALTTILSFAVPATVQLSQKFDIIHAQGFCGLRQNVVTAHISQVAWFAAIDRQQLPQSLRKRIFRHLAIWLDSVAYRPAAAREIIAVSERLRADLVRYHKIERDLPVIHHGVDTAQFSPANVARWRHHTRQMIGASERDFVALYVGDWQKAAESLVETLRRVPELVLWIVTKTSRSQVELDLQRAGVRSRATLIAPTGTIERIFAGADCLLFPSFYDAFGMVVAEGMASGLPVVVSGAAGASEWIQHGQNGLVVGDPADFEGYAVAVRELMLDATKRATLAAAARATAEVHSWDSVAARTLEVYERVVAARRQRQG